MALKIDHISLSGTSLGINIDAGDDPKDMLAIQTALANMALSSADEIVDALMGLRKKAAPAAKLSDEQPYTEAKPAEVVNAPAPKAERKPRVVSAPAAVAPAAEPVLPVRPLPGDKAIAAEKAAPKNEATMVDGRNEPEGDPMDALEEAGDPELPLAVMQATKMREVVTALHTTFNFSTPEQFEAWAQKHHKSVPALKSVPNPVSRVKVAGQMLLSGG